MSEKEKFYNQFIQDISGPSGEIIRSIINLIDFSVIILNFDGIILEANNGAARLYGCESRKELIGQNLYTSNANVSPEENIKHVNKIKTHPYEKFGGIFTLRKKDGNTVLADVRIGVLIKSGNPVGMCAVSTVVTDSNVTEQKLKRSRDRIRDLSKHIELIGEKQKADLAREFHDELGPLMSTMRHSLGRLEYKLDKKFTNRDDAISNNIAEIDGLINSTVQSMRRISAALRPAVLDDFGLVAAIEWQAKKFQESTGIKYKLSLDSELTFESPELETALFRIFQEALTNVSRHAQASMIWIILVRKGKALQLEVRDNGKGITHEQINSPDSFGIIGMQERARSFGGKVKIYKRPTRGTTLSVIIPLHAEAYNV